MKTSVLKAIRAATDAQLAEIALSLAERFPEAFERLLIPPTPPTPLTTRLRGEYPNGKRYDITITAHQLNQILTAGREGKIQCIRAVRAITGLCLYDAKCIVDDNPTWCAAPEHPREPVTRERSWRIEDDAS